MQATGKLMAGLGLKIAHISLVAIDEAFAFWSFASPPQPVWTMPSTSIRMEEVAPGHDHRVSAARCVRTAAHRTEPRGKFALAA